MIYRYYTKQEDNYKQRVTIVGKYIGENLVLAAARCSEKDQFVRKVGRELAEDRLQKGMYVNSFVNVTEKANMTEVQFFVRCAAAVAFDLLVDKETIRRSKLIK